MANFAVNGVGLSKIFGDVTAVNNLDITVKPGEILAVVGPSGCGKTTALRLIAGFEKPDTGRITLGENIVADERIHVPPEKRGVGMVFQEYALFPHLTVFDNVSFGLNRNNHREADTISMLKLVGLEVFAERYPHELSGGQRQRVALARALAPRPILILLDEPFSNLDADLRLRMREEVRVILRGINATAIFVTHDQEEALFMGDRLAVMYQGEIVQVGTPEEIFHQPATRFVAEFMGKTDFLPGEVVATGIETEIGLIPQKLELKLGTKVELAVRADDIGFEPDKNSKSLVLARHFQGAMNLYRLRLPSGRLLHAYQPHTNIISPRTTVRVWAEPGHPLACFINGSAVKSTI
ncbi:MAG: ABC transporter ATP-binding protein [Chloroflexi bacterium]|nr:ABC transporter ATP-binding protein [Chloroflexota bacterium]